MAVSTNVGSLGTSTGSEKPAVSICCATYQHESYIRTTIDGFLLQRTSFPFEIIIHDDASTDSTQHIISEYAQRFPSLFRNVLQSENQLSQGREVFRMLYELAEGKYIALCEGDDYWTDPLKLQKQVDLLEASPAAAGCFHCADDLMDSTGTVTPSYWAPPGRLPSYELDDLLPRLTFAATASVMLRRQTALKVPFWAGDVPHGDFGLLAVALLDGPLLYIDESMSVYRRHATALHSTTYGSIADLRALQSLITVGQVLGLQNRDSYREGIRWRMQQLENSINRDNAQIKILIADLNETQVTYERARRSRFFRFGVAVDRLRKQFYSAFTSRIQESE